VPKLLLTAVLAGTLLGVPGPLAAAADSPPGWSALAADLDAVLGVAGGMRDYQPPGQGAGCDRLSLEVTRLLPLTERRYPDLYRDPLLGAGFALGTVFTPGFLLMAVPGYTRYREGVHLEQARLEVERLRARLADLDCYVR